MRVILLTSLLLVFTSCVKATTWSGDVYNCDRELLERVAAAKAEYAEGVACQMK